MLKKTLTAALKSPELLNQIQLRSLTNPDIVLGFQALAIHKPEPPLFYSQFLYSFLTDHYRHRLILNTLDYSSFMSFARSVLTSFSLKPVKITQFSIEEKIDLIKSVSELSLDPKYNTSAESVLEELCGSIIRSENFITPEQSAVLLKSIYKKTQPLAADILKKMCKAHIFTSKTIPKTDLKFYDLKDEFYEFINNS